MIAYLENRFLYSPLTLLVGEMFPLVAIEAGIRFRSIWS